MDRHETTDHRIGVGRRRWTVMAVGVALALAAGLVPVPASAGATVAVASLGTTRSDDRTTSEVFAVGGSATAGRAGRAGAGVRPGSTTSLAVAPGSQAAGVSWAGSTPGTVAIRGRTPSGWSPWVMLDGETDEAPDASARTGAGPFWFGSAGVDRVEVRVEDGTLAGLEVQAIHTDPGTVDGTAARVAVKAAATDGRPTIQPRSSWTSAGWVRNPDCEPTPQSAIDGLFFAVVHHTDNANGYAASDVPAMLRSIYAFHTGSNKWCDIAYNFLIDRFGRIWEGRLGGVDQPIIGGHAKGFNTNSVGVAFLGQHQPGASPAAVRPSAASLTAAGQIIGWKLALHNRDPQASTLVVSKGSPKYPEGQAVTLHRVSGHRDVGLTSCPGDLLYTELATIRATAKAYEQAMPAPPAAIAPFRLSSVFVTQSYRDILFRSPADDRYAYWSSQIPRTKTPEDLLAYLVASSDADTVLHSLTRLYRAYFLRLPDHAGFTYWLGKRLSGWRLATTSEAFARSSEFTTRYGSLDDAAFVAQVYRNVLGREADPAGTAYWTDQLARGMARGEVMTRFSQANEYVTKTQRGNEIVALWETLLGRAVDAPTYNSLLADTSKTMTDIARIVFVSQSYRRRFATPT